jgi:hypothetical protein
VAKALQWGMREGPRALAVQQIDFESGTVKLTIAGRLAERFPEFSAKLFTAGTMRDNALFFASSACERN